MVRPDRNRGQARWLVVVAVLAWPRAGAAQPPASPAEQRASVLAREGNELADQERYAEAIARWKQAEELSSRLLHPCNIGLAYARWQQPAQAHLFLRLCRERALRDAVSVPAWVDARLAEVEAALRGGGFGQLRVTAAGGADLQASVSAFAADERFELPRTIWLPAGNHELTGYRDRRAVARLAIDVRAGETTDAQLAIAPAPVARPAVVPAPRPRRARLSRWGLALATTGVAAMVGGGVFHYLAADARAEVSSLPVAVGGTPYPEYDELVARFHRQRALAIGLYAAGAVATATGTYLLLRSRGGERVTVSLSPTGAGAGLELAGAW